MTEIATIQNRTVDRMQVRLEHLDTLLSLAGEVIITAANLQDLERRTTGTGSAATGLGTESMHLIKSCNQATRRVSQDLHDLVMAIRLVEIDETYRLLRRPVRDLCRNLGCDAEVEFAGSDTLIDKALAERLLDPLLHLLRNAIDHGIETSIERKRHGKSLTGRVVVSARDAEHDTTVTISDDGAGIDEQAVREQAATVLGAAAAQAPLLDLICRPGLSTAGQVTGTSGRGVGLDLVKSVVDEFDGEITLETEQHRGSTFTLRIPKLRAVNIIDALTLQAGDTMYALPIEKVVANLGLTDNDVQTTFDRGRHFLFHDRIVPLHDLQEALGEEPVAADGQMLPVIILRGRTGEIGFIVSKFLGPQKLVNIPLDDGIDHHCAVAGTAVFTGGTLGLTLDVDTLIATTMGTTAATVQAARLEAASAASAPTERAASTDDEEARAEHGGAAPSDGPAGGAASSDEEHELRHELASSLSELQDALLSLEQDPDDQDQLNRAFRRLHAAKGHFSLLALEQQAVFAHHLETALDYLRTGRVAMTAERMDLLLDGVSHLIEAADGLPSLPSAPPTNLLTQLQELTDHDTVSAEEGRDYESLVRQPFNLTPTAQLGVLSALKRGERTYETFLEFDPGRQPGFLASYLLLRRVGKAGTIIATLPEVEDIEQGRCGREVKVLWSTSLGEDGVDALFDRLTTPYHLREHRSIPTTIFRYEGGESG